MDKETAAMAADQKITGSGYLNFIIKVAIVTAIAALGLAFIAESIEDAIPPLKNRVRQALKDPRTQIRLKGFLTTNPAVSYRVSLMEEKDGNLEAAIDEIELAIGLLELHSADRATQDKYTARLMELKRKLAAPAPAKAVR
jgi:hypothetical protein